MKMNKDYYKMRVTFHTDEGKYDGHFGDDTIFDTMDSRYGKRLAKLEAQGFHPGWYIEPISQELDDKWGKRHLGAKTMREWPNTCWKVEAELVLFSNELFHRLNVEFEDKVKGMDGIDRIWTWNYICRPYVEEALGRKWTCPHFDCLFDENDKKRYDEFVNG